MASRPFGNAFVANDFTSSFRVEDDLSVPEGYRVEDGWIVRDDGVKGKFTFALGDRSNLFVSKEDIESAVEGQASRASDYSLRINTLFKFKDPVPVVKSLCDSCGFAVNPVGHSSRCRPLEASTSSRRRGIWSSQRLLAWLGDTLYQADIKVALLLVGTPTDAIGERYAQYVGAEYQSRWFNNLADTSWLAQPTGSSVHNVSTAFECNYVNEVFRLSFLSDCFGAEVAREVMRRVHSFDVSGF